jgi:hypothetical protein
MRRRAAITLALAAVVAAAGCGPGAPPGGNVSDTAAMQAVADEIQGSLARRPDVVSATVVYQDSVTAPAQAYLTVAVTAGAALDPVAAEATRMVWQSRLHPLRHIDIRVADTAQSRGDHVVWDLPKDSDQLTAAYGPRPASS